jgi:hypothetical protein
MTAFCFSQLRSGDGAWQSIWERLRGGELARIETAGISLWGAFVGVFGLGSSDLLLLTQSTNDSARPRAIGAAEIVAQLDLMPTARPALPAAALSRSGLYVLRFFDLDEANVDEFVALSTSAWQTFERGAGYSAEPMGLFRSFAGAPSARMLLVTWYDGFASWEASRRPPDAARENFARRHALTRATIAYATRLAGPA